MINYRIYNLLPSFETNTYLIWDEVSHSAIIIDPAAPNEKLKLEVCHLNLNVKCIINTHGHGDHIGGNDFFQKAFHCPIAIHNLDAKMLVNSDLNLSSFMEQHFVSPPATISLNEESEIILGEHIVQIIHTPGHTQGGVAIYLEPYLFSGDTLFHLDIGRTDLPGGNYEQLIDSIKHKIFVLPNETTVFPGHGTSSTIENEKQNNPYLKKT